MTNPRKDLLKNRFMKMREAEFFEKMGNVWPLAKDMTHMQAAIEVMQQRFPHIGKEDQLVWSLNTAIRDKRAPMIDFLMEQGAKTGGSYKVYTPHVSLTTQPMFPLKTAARAGNTDLVRRFIDSGVDVQAPPCLLHDALKQPEILQLLVRAGRTKDAGENLYEVVSGHGSFEVADILIDEARADINADNGHLLFSVIQQVLSSPERTHRTVEQTQERLEYCLKKGANPRLALKRFEELAALYPEADFSKSAAFTRKLLGPKLVRPAPPKGP